MTPKAFTNVVSNTHAKIKDNIEKAEDIIKTQPAQPIKINQPVREDTKIIVPPAQIKEDIKKPETNNEVSFDIKKIEKKYKLTVSISLIMLILFNVFNKFLYNVY